MRRLIYTINVTIDACCDHTKVGPPDEELFDYYIQLVRDADLLYGRKTYQLMVPYWPDIAKNQNGTRADIEFAQAFDSANKIVFSRSLEKAEGGNTRLVRGDFRQEIVKLKQEQGKDIYVGGRSPLATDRAWSGGRISHDGCANPCWRRQTVARGCEPTGEIAIETC